MRNVINCTLSVDVQRLADLLCSALEGGSYGSGYWAKLEDKIAPKAWTIDERPVYKTEEEARARENFHYAHWYPFNEGGALVFSVISEERDEAKAREEESKRYTLDIFAIRNGLDAWAADAMRDEGERSAHPRYFADFIRDNTDAETGDIFLQYCLFGKVIYG